MLKRFLFLMCGIALFSQVFASVGDVSLLRGSADINRYGKVLEAKNLMPIEAKDGINTKEKTKMQITFQDDTVITLGSLTSFRVDEYLEDDKNSKASFSITSGAFKVMTGKIGKLAPKKFTVKTINASIGIRGTIFVGEVNFDTTGKDYISCIEGKIVVKSNKKNEEITLSAGEMVIINIDGVIEKTSALMPEKFSLLPKYKNDTSTAVTHKSKSIKSEENTVSKTIERRNQWNNDLAYADKHDQRSPTSLQDMQDLVNNATVQSYSGKGSGTINQTQREGANSLVSQGNLQADFGLEVDFGGNAPAQFSIKNQQVNLTSVVSNGKSLSQNQLADLSSQINAKSTDQNIRMDTATINQNNASLVSKKTTPTQEITITGKFENTKAKNFSGNVKQTTNIVNGANSVHSQINANFDLSKN